MKHRQLWLGFGAAAGMGILILDSGTALLGAREGLGLCIRSLIPSLFPFFVLSGLMIRAFAGVDLPMLRPFAAFLGIPSGCESLLIPAFLGGYPAGAQCIAQALSQDSLHEDTARRLLLFCNNAGPAFLFGVLGPVFPSDKALWALWAIQITSAVLCARLLPGKAETGKRIPAVTVSLTACLSFSVRIMGNVCGWVILFRILIAFLERWFLWLLPASVRVAVTGLLELSNGCCALAEIKDFKMRFLLCSGMLSFGGLCVAMQTASAAEPLPVLPYLGAKLMQSLFCLCISGAFLYRKPILLVVMLLFFFLTKNIVTSSGCMLYNKSIKQRRNPYAVSKENRARLYVLPARNKTGGGSGPLL